MARTNPPSGNSHGNDRPFRKPDLPAPRERDEFDDDRNDQQPPVPMEAHRYVWPPDDQNVGSPYWAVLLHMTRRNFHEQFHTLAIPGFGSKSVIYVNSKDLRLALAKRRSPPPLPPRGKGARRK